MYSTSDFRRGLRILHEEFTAAANQLEILKSQLIPKGKFTFRRYREALASQAFSNSTTVSVATTDVSPSSKTQPVSDTKSTDATLYDLVDCDIAVHADGSVTVNGDLSSTFACDSPFLSFRNVSGSTIAV